MYNIFNDLIEFLKETDYTYNDYLTKTQTNGLWDIYIISNKNIDIKIYSFKYKNKESLIKDLYYLKKI